MEQVSKNSDSINSKNFRDTASKAIEAYGNNGRIVDMMVWSAIIAHYNKALDDADKREKELVDVVRHLTQGSKIDE